MSISSHPHLRPVHTRHGKTLWLLCHEDGVSNLVSLTLTSPHSHEQENRNDHENDKDQYQETDHDDEACGAHDNSSSWNSRGRDQTHQESCSPFKTELAITYSCWGPQWWAPGWAQRFGPSFLSASSFYLLVYKRVAIGNKWFCVRLPTSPPFRYVISLYKEASINWDVQANACQIWCPAHGICLDAEMKSCRNVGWSHAIFISLELLPVTSHSKPAPRALWFCRP